jgi:tRNA(His) 5'-end guanylyltransferase
MNETAMYLCKNIQGAQLAYVQSDEISILVHNYKEIETQSWFDNTLQKMVSVSAGMASAVFTSLSPKIFGVHKLAIFDSRAFIVPEADVNNYFLWRQQDATRNSVQMLARSLYSHKQCEDKNNSELQELCHEKGVNWNDCPTSQKRGRCIVKITAFCDGKDPRTGEVTKSLRTKWTVDNEIPIFSQDKSYINGYLLTTEAAELAQIT